MTTTPESAAPAPAAALEGTAAALVDAAIALFGAQGYAATSIRQIAARAGTNLASIAYHFGGKDGLHRACGTEIARRMQTVLAAAAPGRAQTPAEARRQLIAFQAGLAGFILGGSANQDMVAFMLREAAEDGPVLDSVYATMLAPAHREMCRLWALATGSEAESEATRLAVFSMIGQVIYFRIGKNIVARRMGWDSLGPDQARDIIRMLGEQLTLLLDRETPP